MIIDGKSYPDNDIEELRHTLKLALRARFIMQYHDKELSFAMSFEGGRYDDCVKDIQRGRVSLRRGLEILQSAVAHGLYTAEQAEEYFAEKWRQIEIL